MSLETVAKVLSSSNTIAVLSGAGISAESGVPTFRDAGGLYAGKSPYELASPEGFAKNPDLVWDWYEMRREAILKVKPNPGHFALAQMEKVFSRVYIITQNVDGLHRLAGSKDIVELHGNIHRNICNECREESSSTSPRSTPCRFCGGRLRPGVVWFGEALSPADLKQAAAWLDDAQALLVIGTSGVVYPAAGFAHAAKANGLFVVEINSGETDLSDSVDEIIRAPSGEALPKLLQLLQT